jgi:hypothetical protein
MLGRYVKNPMGLIHLECLIGLKLVFENPLAGDNIGTVEAWN